MHRAELSNCLCLRHASLDITLCNATHRRLSSGHRGSLVWLAYDLLPDTTSCMLCTALRTLTNEFVLCDSLHLSSTIRPVLKSVRF